MQKASNTLFEMQEAEYGFPYHHIPFVDNHGTPMISRTLWWGLEYLIYTRHVVDLILAEQPRSVLDVGCGDGRLLGMLPTSIQFRVGCDLSTRAIEMARAFNPSIDFRNIAPSEIVEQFDAVILVEVLEHIPDSELKQFVTSTAARMRDGGTLIVSVPSTNKNLIPKHYRHYTKDLLRDHLSLSDIELDTIAIYQLIKKRNMFYRLYRTIANAGNPVSIDSPWVRTKLWESMWRSRVRQDDGLHVLGIFKRPG